MIMKDNTWMDHKDIRIIRILFWNQAVTLKINLEDQTNTIKILQGVRQAYIYFYIRKPVIIYIKMLYLFLLKSL